jgi:hypothetical protein
MKRGILAYLTPVFAIILACIVGYYSVTGLSKLFAGAATAVIVLGATLESVKILGTALLHVYWKKFSWFVKGYMIIGVIILMGITSAGVYGLLTSAYQDTAYKLEMEDGVIQSEKNKMLVYQKELASIENQQESLDKSVSDVNSNILQLSEGLANNVVQYTDASGNLITTQSSSTRRILQEQLNSQTVYRDTLVSKRDRLNVKYQALNDSITSLEIKILEIKSNSDAANELGPLMYVAELTGKPMDQVINWFMLLIIFVADPFAVILVIATTKIWHKEEEESTMSTRNNVFKGVMEAIKRRKNKPTKEKREQLLSQMMKSDEETGIYDTGSKEDKTIASEEDAKVFVNAIENPTEPNEKLKKAAEDYKEAKQENEYITKKEEDIDYDELIETLKKDDPKPAPAEKKWHGMNPKHARMKRASKKDQK